MFQNSAARLLVPAIRSAMQSRCQAQFGSNQGVQLRHVTAQPAAMENVIDG